MKYKYIIYDIDGFLTESYDDHYGGILFSTREEAEEAAIKDIEKIEKDCRESYENPLITGYSVEEVK